MLTYLAPYNKPLVSLWRYVYCGVDPQTRVECEAVPALITLWLPAKAMTPDTHGIYENDIILGPNVNWTHSPRQVAPKGVLKCVAFECAGTMHVPEVCKFVEKEFMAKLYGNLIHKRLLITLCRCGI